MPKAGIGGDSGRHSLSSQADDNDIIGTYRLVSEQRRSSIQLRCPR